MFKRCCNECNNCWYIGYPSTCTCPDENPKREWVGLTNEEVNKCFEFIIENDTQAIRFYQAIEAKLKEKNT